MTKLQPRAIRRTAHDAWIQSRLCAGWSLSLIPVVLSDKQDRMEGIKAGADEFLTRPVDRAELLARVRPHLRLKRRTDELERAEAALFTLARSVEDKHPYTHSDCDRL
jgi:putative two-component system response regulator